MKKFWGNKKGFTIVEMLTVIVIIMVLVAVSYPLYASARRQAREAAFNANVRSLQQAGEMHIIDGGKDAIWSAEGGQKAGETISGVHESWYRYMNMWPVNPLDSGDYVVEIVGTNVSVSPDSFEGE